MIFRTNELHVFRKNSYSNSASKHYSILRYRAWRRVMGPVKWANPYKAVARSIGEYSRLNQPTSLHKATPLSAGGL